MTRASERANPGVPWITRALGFGFGGYLALEWSFLAALNAVLHYFFHHNTRYLHLKRENGVLDVLDVLDRVRYPTRSALGRFTLPPPLRHITSARHWTLPH
jgi:hypothetical protein